MTLAAVAQSAAVNVLRGSLRLCAIRNGRPHVALVVDQKPCALGAVLADGYRAALASLRTDDSNSPIVCHEILFNPHTFLDEMQRLQDSIGSSTDVVDELVGCVLVQRGAFQNELKSYRLRLRLFEMGLRVAEHAHLAPMSAQHREMNCYLQSCSYPAEEAQREGKRIADALDAFASSATPLHILSRSPGSTSTLLDLRVDGYLEKCLLNTGNYEAAWDMNRNCLRNTRAVRKDKSLSSLPAATASSNMGTKQTKSGATIGVSIGGTFPTGEVITEAEDLGALNGQASIFAFPNTSKRMEMVGRPFEVTIRDGTVTHVAPDAPATFHDLIQLIRDVEGEVVVRELGFGINPFLGRQDEKFLTDVTSFERQRGVHLSLGKRHPLFVKRAWQPSPERPLRPSVYRRSPLKRKDGTFHVDVFVDAVSMKVAPTDGCSGGFECHF